MLHRLTTLGAVLAVAALAGCQTMAARPARTVADDTSTTEAVRSRLATDRPASLASVGVETVNGVVHLTGIVETPDQRLRAEQLTWQTPGVQQVINNIQVQRPGVALAPSASVVTAPAVVRRSVAGTVSSVDATRSQVTVATGTEQLLLQLPPAIVRDVRPGDQIILDVSVRPAR